MEQQPNIKRVEDKIRDVLGPHTCIEFRGIDLFFPREAALRAGVPEAEGDFTIPDETYEELMKSAINPNLN
jgi:hypothetical protein